MKRFTAILASFLLLVAFSVPAVAGSPGNGAGGQKDPAGWYQHSQTGMWKFFENGHPGSPSQWTYCEDCGDNPMAPPVPLADASAVAGTIGGADSFNGFAGFDDFAAVEVRSANADSGALAVSFTTFEANGPGFVENIAPGAGLVTASSKGDASLSSTNIVIGKIFNPTDGYAWFMPYGYGYWASGGHFTGDGQYNFELGIDAIAGQSNGALAQIGLGPKATWAGGGNYTGGSIDATFEGKGRFTTEKGYYVEGWLFWPYYGYYYNYPGFMTASLLGDIDAEGFTKAFAFRTRDEDNALAAAGAVTAGRSSAEVETKFCSNGCLGKRSFTAELHAFGEGSVAHFSFAELPDTSVYGGTYGEASFGYNNVQTIDLYGRGLPNAQVGVDGGGIAGTFGVTKIARTDHVTKVTSFAVSGAGTNMPSGYSVPGGFDNIDQ